MAMDASIPHSTVPCHAAVRDLTRDGRLSTYDESVLKLSKVHSGENAHAWDTL
jgi:hypothetical protein